MHAYDYECVEYDGAYYCNECLPEGITTESEEVYPVFACAEVYYYPVCNRCGGSHEYMQFVEE